MLHFPPVTFFEHAVLKVAFVVYSAAKFTSHVVMITPALWTELFSANRAFGSFLKLLLVFSSQGDRFWIFQDCSNTLYLFRQLIQKNLHDIVAAIDDWGGC